jgi:hypothetical protein
MKVSWENLLLPAYSTPCASFAPEQTSQVKVSENREEKRRRNIHARSGERKIFVRQCVARQLPPASLWTQEHQVLDSKLMQSQGIPVGIGQQMLQAFC